jgi:riboflavin-specific deaminase-like protein
VPPIDTDPLLDSDRTWDLLLQVAALAARPDGLPRRLPLDEGIVLDTAGGAVRGARLDGDAQALLDLFLPFARGGPARPVTIGQLGQSLDGRIATAAGRSHYITGEAGLVHLHRLRGLAQAVIVGAATVHYDDPRLTTRRVPGPNPVRVVLDPRCRLGTDRHVFRDNAAPTLLMCAAAAAGGREAHGQAEVLPLPADGDGPIPCAAVLTALHRRGLHRVLVEGGGVTVSRFLEDGQLDRLHLTVAPLLIGSGRPAITLPEIDTLELALRPQCRRVFLGEDTLFDCALTPGA